MHLSSCTPFSLPKPIPRVKGTRSSSSPTVQCRRQSNMSWPSTIQFQAWKRHFRWALLRSSGWIARVTLHIEYAALLSLLRPLLTCLQRRHAGFAVSWNCWMRHLMRLNTRPQQPWQPWHKILPQSKVFTVSEWLWIWFIPSPPAAASCLINLVVKESDNNVKLIVLDRIENLRSKHGSVIDGLVMDLLQVLSRWNTLPPHMHSFYPIYPLFPSALT